MLSAEFLPTYFLIKLSAICAAGRKKENPILGMVKCLLKMQNELLFWCPRFINSFDFL